MRLHPNPEDDYRGKVMALRDLLHEEGTKAEALDIVRGLIQEVDLDDRPGQTSEIELVGHIAAMT